MEVAKKCKALEMCPTKAQAVYYLGSVHMAQAERELGRGGASTSVWSASDLAHSFVNIGWKKLNLK